LQRGAAVPRLRRHAHPGCYDIAVSNEVWAKAAQPPTVRLLISVVSAAEVDAALAGGADVVDVKNPAEGAIGAGSPALLRAVRARVAPPVEMSAALGDAPHLPGTMALAAAGAAACGANYVKVGLLGSARPEQAFELLRAVRQAATDANPQTRLVAVAYADASRVGGLPPSDLPEIARRAGVHGVMLDTAVKDGTSTLCALGQKGVAAFFAEARALGLMTAVAGSLSPSDLPHLRSLGITLVGARGSACEGGRSGIVSADRVRTLRAAIDLSLSASPALAHR
jgi:uncharacterized protein (UPF0264 family)